MTQKLVLSLLLPSHLGKCSTLHAGWWLLNTALCVVSAKAFETVSVCVHPGDKAKAISIRGETNNQWENSLIAEEKKDSGGRFQSFI